MREQVLLGRLTTMEITGGGVGELTFRSVVSATKT